MPDTAPTVWPRQLWLLHFRVWNIPDIPLAASNLRFQVKTGVRGGRAVYEPAVPGVQGVTESAVIVCCGPGAFRGLAGDLPRGSAGGQPTRAAMDRPSPTAPERNAACPGGLS